MYAYALLSFVSLELTQSPPADLKKASDPLKWKFPVDNVKSNSGWNCEWTAEDDAHLMVGVWKYGHGCWEAMRDDDSLGFKDKFFLEDAKNKSKDEKARIPNAIHLVRRADYLCHLLHDLDGSGRSDSKPSGSKTHQPRAGSSAPRPKSSKAKDDTASVAGSTSSKTHKSSSKPAKSVKRKATPEYSDSEEDAESSYDSMDEESCKEALRPVKRELKRLKQPTTDMTREEKLAHLKDTLTAIGARIEVVADFEKSSSAKEKKRKHLCTCESRLVHPLPLTLVSPCREMDELLLAEPGDQVATVAPDVRPPRRRQGLSRAISRSPARSTCAAQAPSPCRRAASSRQKAAHDQRHRSPFLQPSPFRSPEHFVSLASPTSSAASSCAACFVVVRPFAAIVQQRHALARLPAVAAVPPVLLRLVVVVPVSPAVPSWTAVGGRRLSLPSPRLRIACSVLSSHRHRSPPRIYCLHSVPSRCLYSILPPREPGPLACRNDTPSSPRCGNLSLICIPSCPLCAREASLTDPL